MPKKKVISILEFLRTGIVGNIACGCKTNDVIQQFGRPDYIYHSGAPSSLTYGSLEIWFHPKENIVYRITFKNFKLHYWEKTSYKAKAPKRRTHEFRQSKLIVPRVKFDPWVVRDGMDVFTLMRFLKMAKIEYWHSQWWGNKNSAPDQLNLDSGVQIFFDPPNSHSPGVGFIEMKDEDLYSQLFDNWY
jgi:hypothetical protein